MASNSRKQALTYLFFVLLFSCVFYYLMLRAHSLGGGRGPYVVGIMWCPGLAALLTMQLNRRPLRELGWKWPSRRYTAMSWLIPIGYASVAYLVVWTFGFGGFPNHAYMDQITKRMSLGLSPAASSLLYVALTGTFGMAGSLSNALGEEIGWRGFLVPELSKTFSFTATSLISGVVWAAWHAPILVGGDYNAGTRAWYGLTCFAVLVISMSFVFAWMRLASGSLWTGALLHASHNLYIQSIFTPFTRDTGRTAWYIDEFGAVLPVVTVCVAIYFWRRRKELTIQSDGQPSVSEVKAATSAS